MGRIALRFLNSDQGLLNDAATYGALVFKFGTTTVSVADYYDTIKLFVLKPAATLTANNAYDFFIEKLKTWEYSSYLKVKMWSYANNKLEQEHDQKTNTATITDN
mgnify:CR=1 FL=1